ncbi:MULTISPECIES: biliverdin-producing heme oxygenase [unclassified Massilia]|uniref:biliverdin-producing heme oxygenase n=1 Tax=unclassified Massilia TaxID=2609279 RepID=UPI001B83389E|nr:MULTISPECIES: biliverdin-producing heme oxygenase [unclassified Massilia]MBQ5940295.1 biliverdin-producing heme oxygenase [Massilia sp. AB1]MBQ5962707.1 biliverdin-producing heme oxygenase [Massilia sp. ZL223]
MNQFTKSASAPDVLAALRSATASRHERLDSGLPLSGAQAGLEEYALHLSMVRDWLRPLEGWFAGFADGPQAALARVERLALIERDLAEPGMPAMASPAADRAWPQEASAAYRWGVCYVIEGSQLGGTVLYGRLAERLAPHPLRYLRGAAEGPGARWREFMLALRTGVRTQEEIAEACAGACEAFDRIIELGLKPEQTGC